MKKIIIIALTVLATGFVSSCSKENSVKPAVKATIVSYGEFNGTGSADANPPQ